MSEFADLLAADAVRMEREAALGRCCGNCVRWSELYEGGHGVCLREMGRDLGTRTVGQARALDWIYGHARAADDTACGRYEEES